MVKFFILSLTVFGIVLSAFAKRTHLESDNTQEQKTEETNEDTSQSSNETPKINPPEDVSVSSTKPNPGKTQKEQAHHPTLEVGLILGLPVVGYGAGFGYRWTERLKSLFSYNHKLVLHGTAPLYDCSEGIGTAKTFQLRTNYNFFLNVADSGADFYLGIGPGYEKQSALFCNKDFDEDKVDGGQHECDPHFEGCQSFLGEQEVIGIDLAVGFEMRSERLSRYLSCDIFSLFFLIHHINRPEQAKGEGRGSIGILNCSIGFKL